MGWVVRTDSGGGERPHEYSRSRNLVSSDVMLNAVQGFGLGHDSVFSFMLIALCKTHPFTALAHSLSLNTFLWPD